MARLFKLYSITLAICTLLTSQLTLAYEITSLDVSEVNKTYDVQFSAKVVIPADILIDYIKDIENIGLIIPSVEKVEVINSTEQVTTVNAVMKPCILYICKRIYKSSIVTMTDNGLLLNGLKNKGSFQFIDESLNVRIIDERNSLIYYKSKFKPAFFMPPMLGELIMKQSMKKYLRAFLNVLETKYSDNDISEQTQ